MLQPKKLSTDKSARKQDTRHRILMAALKLVEYGQSPSSLGLRAVAREAGMAAPSIYNHFKNMDELGLALLDDRLMCIRGLARSARQEMSATDATQVLQALMQNILVYMQHYETTLRLIIQQWFNPNPEYRRTIRRELAAIRQDLSHNIEHSNLAKNLEPEQIDTQSEAILSLLIMFLIDAMDLDQQKRKQRLAKVEQQILMLVRGSQLI